MNDMFLENKDKYEGMSPILLLGIGCIIIPYLLDVFGARHFHWLVPIGIIITLIGAGHTMYIKMR